MIPRQKTLPTILGTYMKLVTKYQISAIISCWEKCDEKCAYMFNVYKNQRSRQTGSRNLTGPKTLHTIWYTYMTLVTKYQISAINSYWEKCDEKYLGRTEGRTDRGKTVYPPSGSGGINMALLSITIVQVKRLLPIDFKQIKWPKQMSMTWLTATNICVTNDHEICSICRNHNLVLSSCMTYHWVCNKSNTWVSHVEQELLTLPKHPSSLPLFGSLCCSIFSFLCSVL